VLTMIGEDKALIQTPRKKQMKRNQERDKGNRTDMDCHFYKYFFYFISLYALVSSYCLTFYLSTAKCQEAGRRGPHGGKKETKGIERT